MKLLYTATTVALFMTACVPEDVEEGTVESASTWNQGTQYQGTQYQGTQYQGTQYQGTQYQGTQYQSATYSTSTIQGTVTINKSTIELWRRVTSGIYRWEQRTPTQICKWDEEQVNSSCVTYSLTSSPLINVRMKGRFYDPNTGLTKTGTIKIVSLIKDTSYASHPLSGAGAGTVIACDNPRGCARNTDLYLYDLDLIDSDGSIHNFCDGGQRALALAGTWDFTGQRTSTTSQFSFACTNGTIAKCTQWGYRPFGSARKSNNVLTSMAPYHQSCVRAATADYCANGYSFTQNNTLIDISDYAPWQGSSAGFIPRTIDTVHLATGESATMFEWESHFDNKGATALDFTRYEELYNELGTLDQACPNRFGWGTAPEPDQLHIPRTRTSTIPQSGPIVSVDNTGVCSHNELTNGKFLHMDCSTCTKKIAQIYGADYYCLRADGVWDSNCSLIAQYSCSNSERMGSHSECTQGGGLRKYSTACAFTVVSMYPTCASNWNSTCTNAADDYCTGGLEGASGFPLTQYSFCGNEIGPVSQ